MQYFKVPSSCGESKFINSIIFLRSDFSSWIVLETVVDIFECIILEIDKCADALVVCCDVCEDEGYSNNNENIRLVEFEECAYILYTFLILKYT